MRTIGVQIDLKDNFTSAVSAAFAKARAEMGKFQNQRSPSSMPTAPTNQGEGAAFGVGDMVKANVIANALSSVASGIIDAGQKLVGAFQEQFKSSAEMARGQMGATSANAALLGISWEESTKLTEGISADLAKSALKLPGATKDYLDAFNGVSDTLALSGGLTKDGMTKAGNEMVELVAMLGKASGSGSGATSTVIGKMLSDTGSESLFRIDAFEKVPAFKAILEKDLEKAGKTLGDFFKMSAADKQNALVAVKQRLFSKEYIEAMVNAADSQLDTMVSQLTDPVSGVFGFLRKVKMPGEKGVSTVWTELGKTIRSIGEMGSALVGAIGLGNTDPLVGLINGIRSVRGWIENLTGWFRSLAGGGEFISFGADFGQSIGNGLFNLANMIMTNLPAIAFGFINILGQVGTIALVALGTFMSQLGPAIPSWVASFGEAILVTIGGLGAGFMTFVGPAVSDLGTHLSNLTSAIGSALSGIASGLKGAFDGMVSSVGSAIAGLAGKVQAMVQSIPVIGGMVAGKASYSGNNLHLMQRQSMGGLDLGRVGNAYSGNLLDAIRTEKNRMPPGASLVVANSSELIIPRDRIGEMAQPLNMSFTINADTKDQIMNRVSQVLDTVPRLQTISAF